MLGEAGVSFAKAKCGDGWAKSKDPILSVDFSRQREALCAICSSLYYRYYTLEPISKVPHRQKASLNQEVAKRRYRWPWGWAPPETSESF